MEPKTTQIKLRRLAPRVLRVQARHREKEPGIAAYDHSVVASAEAFRAAYDELLALAAARMNQRGDGKATIETLVRKLRIWAPHIAKDVKTIVASQFGDTPNVPDEVIGDARQLVEQVSRHSDKEGQPLPYLDAFNTDLVAALEAAEADWNTFETSMEGYTALRNRVRETAAQFERDLISYRRSLRAAIGRGHPDYRKLLVTQARTPDEDDDEVGASLIDEEDDDEPGAEDTANDAPVNDPSGTGVQATG